MNVHNAATNQPRSQALVQADQRASLVPRPHSHSFFRSRGKKRGFFFMAVKKAARVRPGYKATREPGTHCLQEPGSEASYECTILGQCMTLMYNHMFDPMSQEVLCHLEITPIFTMHSCRLILIQPSTGICLTFDFEILLIKMQELVQCSRTRESILEKLAYFCSISYQPRVPGSTAQLFLHSVRKKLGCGAWD